jgi:hypothetical protein
MGKLGILGKIVAIYARQKGPFFREIMKITQFSKIAQLEFSPFAPVSPSVANRNNLERDQIG